MSKIKEIINRHLNIVLTVLVLLVVLLSLLVLTTRTSDISSVDPEDSLAQQQDVLQPEVRGDMQSSTSSQPASQATTTDDTSVSEDTATTDNETVSLDPENPFDVPLTAEAVVVWDMQDQEVLFSRDPDTERPLASLTKIMTAFVASQQNDDPDKEVVITRQHLEALGHSGLVANETWNLYDLIDFMMMRSANDAARAVASASSTSESDGYYAKDFISEMNDTARGLGLDSTYFFNPSGLDLNETLISGGYGTARNIAHLFAHIIETDKRVLEATTDSARTFQTLDGRVHSAQNTNTWLSRFDNVLGSKTGYTVLAGGNLVMGFDLENPVVIVVMGSTRTGRFQDMQTLYNATQLYFQNKSTMESVSSN